MRHQEEKMRHAPSYSVHVSGECDCNQTTLTLCTLIRTTIVSAISKFKSIFILKREISPFEMIELEAETKLALLAAGFTEAQITTETEACGGDFNRAVRVCFFLF